MARLAVVQDERALWRLQRMLPVSAHGRPNLLKFLRGRLPLAGTSPRLTVTNIFYPRDGKSLICKFHVDATAAGTLSFVAPIEQVAFERGHPITHELAAYSKGYEKKNGACLSQDNGPPSCPL